MTTLLQAETNTAGFSVAFIGGGSMASALIGGLIRGGMPPAAIHVVEPVAATRERLSAEYGVGVAPLADAALGGIDMVVWAVKPQHFAEAARQVTRFTGQALHVSVAAGISTPSMAQWLGTGRVVRAMPNTPALIGKGITGLFAAEGVSAADRGMVQTLVAPTGDLLWVEQERLIDAVTAVSGSGPAYIFYVMESMVAAGVQMGLSAEQARRLVGATVAGAAALANASGDSLKALRERVTSKGGTTFAAITSLAKAGLPDAFVEAMWAANHRAAEISAQQGG
ncbi:pyrroline-5-carboxylate reductase [Cupriavidus gilardii J11]|uniref:Pyrroline-5-carboxylate reductase n=1 Tax=Cupriavidus gilardii J11 TaxID=936133 RepID=A0A562BRE9_9BURK|nr:pyrroline-5-carboxylate reductase [Cupriavidus gilardii]TWG87469.1 pyrroline-5-carboxylate reductase [Cupriavidus gilardii J11]